VAARLFVAVHGSQIGERYIAKLRRMSYEYFVEVNTPTVGDYSSFERG
jgi:hypothetical protein